MLHLRANLFPECPFSLLLVEKLARIFVSLLRHEILSRLDKFYAARLGVCLPSIERRRDLEFRALDYEDIVCCKNLTCED